MSRAVTGRGQFAVTHRLPGGTAQHSGCIDRPQVVRPVRARLAGSTMAWPKSSDFMLGGSYRSTALNMLCRCWYAAFSCEGAILGTGG
jgi:hypothetical protein